MDEARIQNDLKAAMRARDMARVYVLRGLIAAVKNQKVEKQVKELTEAEIVALVRKEASKRTETIAYAEKAGRDDLVIQNRAEQKVLDEYLPVQLGAEELEGLIRQLCEELGTSQIGPVMAALRSRHAGQFDGKLASELIRKVASA